MAKIVFEHERSNQDELATRLKRLGQGRGNMADQLDFLHDAFSRLGLPLPAQQEYIETADCGHLMFLTDAGCTIRVEYASSDASITTPGYIDLNSEFVLQPLGRLDGPGLSVCVYPGLVSPWDQEDGKDITTDLNRLSATLNRDRVHFFDLDARGDNIGYLPLTSPAWPRGIPVVIDPGSVIRLSKSLHPVKHALYKLRDLITGQTNQPLRQADLYADLRQHFNDAMTGEGKTMDHFWAGCIAATKAGRLTADWTRLPEQFKSIPAVARAYETRLRDEVPAFRPA